MRKSRQHAGAVRGYHHAHGDRNAARFYAAGSERPVCGRERFHFNGERLLRLAAIASGTSQLSAEERAREDAAGAAKLRKRRKRGWRSTGGPESRAGRVKKGGTWSWPGEVPPSIRVSALRCVLCDAVVRWPPKQRERGVQSSRVRCSLSMKEARTRIGSSRGVPCDSSRRLLDEDGGSMTPTGGSPPIPFADSPMYDIVGILCGLFLSPMFRVPDTH